MKIKIPLLFFLILLFFLRVHADKLEKGFQRLYRYDYFLAKEYFEQSLKKKTPGAAYGLSMIFSKNNNPFYDLDSAKHYILLCDSTFHQLKDKEIKYYLAWDITAINIQSQKDLICDKAFDEVSAKSTVESLDQYMKDFSFCLKAKAALELRNAVAYRQAKTINTSASYKRFMDMYPDTKEAHEAAARYEERIFEETTANKSIASYENYLRLYPESPYKSKAEKIIYTLSVPHKTIEEYYAFSKKYPNNRHAEESWREIFNLFTKDYNEQVFLNFKTRFPDYPFMNELETDYRMQRSFFLPFSKDNLWGFLNEAGEEMIKPEYEEVSFFSEGLAAVQKEGKFGYINKTGKVMIPFSFDDAESFKSNTAIVRKGDKSGLIGRRGEELIPFIYDDLADPSEDIYVAVSNEKSGYVSRSGKKLTGFIFDFAGDFRDGYAVAGSDEKYGLVNNAGSFIFEPQYEEILFLSNNLLKAKQNDLWGIIDLKGDVITPFVYEAIGDYSCGRALVAKNKKCGFVDEQGKVIIPIAYPFQESLINSAFFRKGYVLLKQKTKSVLFDSSGVIVSFPGYENIGLPSEGLVPVKKNNKWGFADMNGKIKIACSFDDANYFENGFAKIKMKKLTGVVDASGSTVVAPAYEDITFKDNYFLTRNAGKLGLISRGGMVLLPAEYDRMEFLTDKIVSAHRDDRLLYVNALTGKIIWKEKE